MSAVVVAETAAEAPSFPRPPAGAAAGTAGAAAELLPSTVAVVGAAVAAGKGLAIAVVVACFHPLQTGAAGQVGREYSAVAVGDAGSWQRRPLLLRQPPPKRTGCTGRAAKAAAAVGHYRQALLVLEEHIHQHQNSGKNSAAVAAAEVAVQQRSRDCRALDMVNIAAAADSVAIPVECSVAGVEEVEGEDAVAVVVGATESIHCRCCPGALNPH